MLAIELVEITPAIAWLIESNLGLCIERLGCHALEW